uniref:Uncharacterized protein n=1 Tax=Arundo donax TaxID=35708 RepID=A0A0A8YCD4_ARUDO
MLLLLHLSKVAAVSLLPLLLKQEDALRPCRVVLCQWLMAAKHASISGGHRRPGSTIVTH